jgi:hypothetical protein
MNAWMVYGPFSLTDATSATVNFWYKNYSESGWDYFQWMASTNGVNFYGQQISGDQNTWRSQTFDLSNVYTIGNLCGKSQVWIAFIFTSDGSIAGPTYTGAFLDDIVVQKDVAGSPDLTPYQPGNWNDKIPIGTSQLAGTDAHSYNGVFYDNQTLYFNWASANLGGASASSYTVHVEVTGTGGGSWDWTSITTPAGNYTYLTSDQPVGPLAAGSHTFRVWVDYNGNVAESNEGNNYYERTITVSTVTPVEYYAERASSPSFSSPINSGWITATQFTFGSLTPGQTYWYHVKARQGSQTSSWSNVEYSMQEAPPPLSQFQAWQLQYFGCTNCPQAAGGADPDGDGMSNTNEFLVGFNPTNSAASFRIISVVRTNNDIKVTYLGANGNSITTPPVASRTNVLEFTMGTANGSYSNNFVSVGAGGTHILSGGTGLGTIASFVHTNGATGATRYYRVRVSVP